MIEVFAAFALGAASSGAAFLVADRSAKRERTSLLDRVMARDYSEFKAYEPRPEAPAPVLTQAERKQQEEESRVAELANGLV